MSIRPAQDCYEAHLIPTVAHFNVKKDIKILWYTKFVTSFDVEWQPSIPQSSINNSNIDIVIIPFSDHCYFLRDQQIEYLSGLTKPYIVLSATASNKFIESKNVNQLNWMFFPYWAITYPVSTGIPIPSEDVARRVERNYLFSCLNGNPSYLRLTNLTWMIRNDHVFTEENSIITCPKQSRNTNDTTSVDQTLSSLQLHWPEGAEIFQKRVIPRLPLVHDTIKPIQRNDVNDHMNILSCNSAAFTDTYINIITETESPYPHVSEKSLKPMINGQLFVTTAVPGTLDLLREIGFDTFDDILEHSRYSEYHNTLTRLKSLHKRLDELSDWNWAEIYRITEERRVYNRELVLSGNIARKYYQQLERAINECVL